MNCLSEFKMMAISGYTCKLGVTMPRCLHDQVTFCLMNCWPQCAVLPHNIEIVMWPQITVTSLHPVCWNPVTCGAIRFM